MSRLQTNDLLVRRWLTALCLLAAGVSQCTAQDYQPEVGRQHFEFVLPGIHDGEPVALSDFRGKKVLLLHFASW